MRYDVLVVGAGPAGSTTARECAARGLSVLLLDKAQFPRDKPCGGGVNARTAQLLPFDLAPVVERVIFGVRLSLHGTYHGTYRWPHPLTYLTERCRLDAFLAEQALRAGATLLERRPVQRVEQDRSVIRIRAGTEAFTGRALVVADGANGRTAPLAGVTPKHSRQLALEGNITPPASLLDHWQDLLGLDLGTVPDGYGWLFPKADHLNVGLGGRWALGPTLRRRLNRLSRFYGLSPDAFWGVRGHQLPTRQPDSPLVAGSILLVGDAAGLVDP